MAWTQADVDNVKSQLHLQSIRHLDGRQVVLPELKDRLALVAMMEAEVAGGTGGSRTTYASTSRD